MSKITAVISSYGYRDFIIQAIDSVLSQSVLPYDILVVDDGAHDGACDVAKKYNLRYIERPENWGILRNYNDILHNHVRTEKMFILAADDWIRPDYIEKMDIDGADIVSSDIALTGCGHRLISKRKLTEVKDGYHIWRFHPDIQHLYKSNYIHGSSIYNVEMARQFNYMGAHNKTEGKQLQEDWMLFRRMIRYGGANHVHVPEPLLYYRRHKFNINGLY